MDIWEIVGVAGSGKTTLKDSIMSSSDDVQPMPSLKKLRLLPVWLYAIARSCVYYFSKRDKHDFDSDYVKRFRHSCRYRLSELRTMSNLLVRIYFLTKAKKNSGKVMVLDQGPIYQIACLNALGTTTERPGVRVMCDMCLERIKEMYSGIVYMTAGDNILEERRKNREDWIKYIDSVGSEANIRAHHKDYQIIYERLMDNIRKDDKVELHIVNSGVLSVPELTSEILCSMDSTLAESMKPHVNKKSR